MNKIFSTILLLSFSLVSTAQNILPETQKELRSPDGRYLATFYQRQYDGGRRAMFYTLHYCDSLIIGESELGVDIDNQLFESALGIENDSCAWMDRLQLTGERAETVDTVWQPLYGENATVADHYNSLTLTFQRGDDTGASMNNAYDKRRFYYFNVEMRAYNEGFALRYFFPEATNGLFINIVGERTSFTMPSQTTAWHAAWAQAPYTVTSLRDWHGEAERPLLLRQPNGMYVALGEARMVDYARGKFDLAPISPANQQNDTRTLRVKLYSLVDITTPYSTPWRVVMAAREPVEIINNKQLYLNLNDECALEDASFIHTGKAFRVCRLDKKTIFEGIDFAKQRGLQFIELDAGWYGPEASVQSQATKVASSRDFTIPEVVAKAKENGLGVWLYVNQRALYTQLDSILPLYKKWGVAGIKFGFVHIGNQHWTTWLHNAVRRCAEYGLMVDIHDEYRPTGFSRTYPNLLTQEGIHGNEEMPTAFNNLVQPFTRFLSGPADYTPCYYLGKIKTTRAHQLAMAVVYYSPLQFLYWYDSPNSYQGEAETKFWADVPTVWTKSIALDGKPGEFIVQARQSGSDWFVGAMNADEERTIELNTADFLPRGERFDVEIYTDDPSLQTRTNVRSEKIENLKAGKKLQLKLLKNGGAALHFIKR